MCCFVAQLHTKKCGCTPPVMLYECTERNQSWQAAGVRTNAVENRIKSRIHRLNAWVLNPSMSGWRNPSCCSITGYWKMKLTPPRKGVMLQVWTKRQILLSCIKYRRRITPQPVTNWSLSWNFHNKLLRKGSINGWNLTFKDRCLHKRKAGIEPLPFSDLWPGLQLNYKYSNDAKQRWNTTRPNHIWVNLFEHLSLPRLILMFFQDTVNGSHTFSMSKSWVCLSSPVFCAQRACGTRWGGRWSCHWGRESN